MPTLLDFRRRIRSVKNTQQITRAMKFIAAARLRRAQETAISLRPYAGGIREVLRSASSRIENPEQFPLLAERPEERVRFLPNSQITKAINLHGVYCQSHKSRITNHESRPHPAEAAPLTTSIISRVMAAWRTLFMCSVSASITSPAFRVADSIAVIRAACSAAEDSASMR